MNKYWFLSYTWDMPGVTHNMRRPFSSKITSVHPFIWLQSKNAETGEGAGKYELLSWQLLTNDDILVAQELDIVPKKATAAKKKKKAVK